MDELQRYGLLSLACLVVLCLALTFKDRDIADGRPEPAAKAKQMSVSEAGESETPSPAYTPVTAEGHADQESARPDDVPLRPAAKSAADADRSKSGAVDPAANAKDKAKPPKELAATGPLSYTIEKGDTLHNIAKEKLGSEKRWPEIAALNPGLKKDSLRQGQVIKLPPREKPAATGPTVGLVSDSGKASEPAKKSADVAATNPAKSAPPEPKPKPKTHRVAKNETLSAIARRYYDDALAWKKIYKANKSKMKSATDIHEGLVLNLP